MYFLTRVIHFSLILGARTHVCSPGTLWKGLMGTGGCFLDDFGGGRVPLGGDFGALGGHVFDIL